MVRDKLSPTLDNSTLDVFLVEDSALLREMLIETLQTIASVNVVGSAVGERTALEQLGTLKADLVIVDIELAQGSGLGILRALREDPQRYNAPKTIVLTNYAHDSIRRRCMELGSLAFFDKSIQIDALVRLVESLRSPADTV